LTNPSFLMNNICGVGNSHLRFNDMKKSIYRIANYSNALSAIYSEVVRSGGLNPWRRCPMDLRRVRAVREPPLPNDSIRLDC
jgi:hypothetical protein